MVQCWFGAINDCIRGRCRSALLFGRATRGAGGERYDNTAGAAAAAPRAFTGCKLNSQVVRRVAEAPKEWGRRRLWFHPWPGPLGVAASAGEFAFGKLPRVKVYAAGRS
ncbi:hypothetical protein EVAR_16343_1 [Eumeta japonica]|uniref:Uncharacterized protein n=1 Tax=Eumeta variegata TaxID=151549 RepID=A0A4C1VE80_EUMVA|nr:hypothetical protein EVAR_16343_1 [Eumeta japonica]